METTIYLLDRNITISDDIKKKVLWFIIGTGVGGLTARSIIFINDIHREFTTFGLSQFLMMVTVFATALFVLLLLTETRKQEEKPHNPPSSS